MWNKSFGALKLPESEKKKILACDWPFTQSYTIQNLAIILQWIFPPILYQETTQKTNSKTNNNNKTNQKTADHSHGSKDPAPQKHSGTRGEFNNVSPLPNIGHTNNRSSTPVGRNGQNSPTQKELDLVSSIFHFHFSWTLSIYSVTLVYHHPRIPPPKCVEQNSVTPKNLI